MSTKAKPTLDLNGHTARDIEALVADKTLTKAAAVKFLTERCANAVAKGRIPKKPSLEALERFGKPFVYQRDELRTRKQIARGTPTLAERKAAPKPKAKRKAAKAKAPAKLDINALVAEYGEKDVLAAFLKLASRK